MFIFVRYYYYDLDHPAFYMGLSGKLVANSVDMCQAPLVNTIPIHRTFLFFKHFWSLESVNLAFLYLPLFTKIRQFSIECYFFRYLYFGIAKKNKSAQGECTVIEHNKLCTIIKHHFHESNIKKTA